jgi:hypothetical protein
MANTTIFQHFVQNSSLQAYKVYGAASRTHIRFSLKDILFNQDQIAALCRSLSRNQVRPLTKTIFGRIIAVSFLPE